MYLNTFIHQTNVTPLHVTFKHPNISIVLAVLVLRAGNSPNTFRRGALMLCVLAAAN